jgi:hypothetical protein
MNCGAAAGLLRQSNFQTEKRELRHPRNKHSVLESFLAEMAMPTILNACLFVVPKTILALSKNLNSNKYQLDFCGATSRNGYLLYLEEMKDKTANHETEVKGEFDQCDDETGMSRSKAN